MDRHLSVFYNLKTGFGAQLILISSKYRSPFCRKESNWAVNLLTHFLLVGRLMLGAVSIRPHSFGR